MILRRLRVEGFGTLHGEWHFDPARVNLLCAVSAGALSYALIERPALRLRHRLDQSRPDRARDVMA